MFTGLVQGIAYLNERNGSRFVFRFPDPFPEVKLGASIALNGCCLTAVMIDSQTKNIAFDLSDETLRLTNLDGLKLNDAVNFENSLKVGDALGGHFVTGHIDATGTLDSVVKEGDFHILKVSLPKDLSRFVIQKGSITLDGISLTVNALDQEEISLTIIPETWSKTNLSNRKVGDLVNIECDMLVKAVVKITEAKSSAT